MKYSDKPLLNVSIRTREKLIYQGQCYTVSSKNVDGVFDLLPYHANFITLIFEYVLLDSGLPSEQKFKIEKGVLYNMSNIVSIYDGI